MPRPLKTAVRFLPILLIIIGMESCGSAQNPNKGTSLEENPPFSIEQAYIQSWVAGIKEGGAGIDMHIIFDSVEPGVYIQDVYFREQIQELRQSSVSPKEYVASFSKPQRKDVVMDIDPIKEAQNTPVDPFPYKLSENEVVISYLFNDTIYYYNIPDLVEKEDIAYPQTNPKQN